MKGLFNTKKSPKKHATGEDVENHYQHQAPPPPVNNINQKQPEPSSPLRSASTSARSPKKSTQQPHPASPASPAQPAQPAQQSSQQRERDSKSRSSRSFVRHSSDHVSSSSRRSKHDPNTHPLNLPPDEYKRLSALSAMSNRSSIDKMDLDKETPPNPPLSPQPQAQASFSVPISSPTNGVKDVPSKASTKSSASGEKAAPKHQEAPAPAPPPHGSRPSSPVPTAADEAEAYKAAGNKFFKEKDYRNAIIQYTKGETEKSRDIGSFTSSLLRCQPWN